jgi:hypothetical protein
MSKCKWCGKDLPIDKPSGHVVGVRDPDDPYGAIELSEEERVAVETRDQEIEEVSKKQDDMIRKMGPEAPGLWDEFLAVLRKDQRTSVIAEFVHQRLKVANGLICPTCYEQRNAELYGEDYSHGIDDYGNFIRRDH